MVRPALLQSHTIGGVVAAGEPIMDIVPGGDELVIAAQVQPEDVDAIQIGSEARIRLTEFNQRTTPELMGRVKSISGDRLIDVTSGLPYYLVFIQLPDDAAGQLAGLSLVPGMPAESFIRTGERTAISFLLKPLMDSFARAMKED
jgi:HlyD family secretion protein